MVACVLAAAGAGTAAALPRTRLTLDSRCDALTGLVPATVAVVTGDMSDARKSARTLRDLAGRELVPRKVKPALRRLARFFTEARHRSIVERATALGGLSSSIATVVEYAALLCSEPATTTTSRPLR